MWRLECKGYKVDDNGKLTVIVPAWSEYSNRYNLYPVNHIRLTGVVVGANYYDHNCYQEWHPDNPFTEKWIECSIILCKWGRNERSEYVIKSMRDMSYPCIFEGREHKTYRYFIPARQLVQLHEHADIKYKSIDREKEECEIFNEAWSSMCSKAISNGYY